MHYTIVTIFLQNFNEPFGEQPTYMEGIKISTVSLWSAISKIQGS